MTLESEFELANTREKLRELEDRYQELSCDLAEDEHVRKLTMFSLKKVINQLKEEIACFEARQPARR